MKFTALKKGAQWYMYIHSYKHLTNQAQRYSKLFYIIIIIYITSMCEVMPTHLNFSRVGFLKLVSQCLIHVSMEVTTECQIEGSHSYYDKRNKPHPQ